MSWRLLQWLYDPDRGLPDADEDITGEWWVGESWPCLDPIEISASVPGKLWLLDVGTPSGTYYPDGGADYWSGYVTPAGAYSVDGSTAVADTPVVVDCWGAWRDAPTPGEPWRRLDPDFARAFRVKFQRTSGSGDVTLTLRPQGSTATPVHLTGSGTGNGLGITRTRDIDDATFYMFFDIRLADSGTFGVQLTANYS